MRASSHANCYEPLVGLHETRLLRLNPGKGDDSLSGRLGRVSLDHHPPYEALSYEWGNPERSHRIALEDGSTVRITESLYRALRDIRHESLSQGSRVVWADAICINQEDINELQQQVSMMGSIYRKATRVVTYIGPEKDESSLAIGFARNLYHYAMFRSEAPDPRLHSAEGLASMGLPPRFDPRWKALRALILRGWASRCWCAQEFLLNENLIMMCGRIEIPDWHLIPSIVQFAFNRSLPIFLLPHSLEDPNSLRECLTLLMRLRLSVTRHGRQSDLLGLLERSHPFQATDPRDKVYSLLGLAIDRDEMALPIDYSCKPEQLYVTVATRILAKSPALDILYSNLNKKSLTLPSWVPDWSTWQFGSHGMAHGSFYSACGSTKPELRVHSLRNRLDISGCLVDKVVRVSSRVGPYYQGHHRQIIPQRNAWVKKEIELVQQLEPYPDGPDTPDVPWRTMIGNITMQEDPADSNYKAFFYAHLNCREESSVIVKDMAREFCDAVRRRSRYRRLAVTEKGYFGAIPETAKIGDWVCMFQGGRHLFVVRQCGKDFTYIGHAYIHGLMSGEVLHADWYKKRTITLV